MLPQAELKIPPTQPPELANPMTANNAVASSERAMNALLAADYSCVSSYDALDDQPDDWEIVIVDSGYDQNDASVSTLVNVCLGVPYQVAESRIIDPEDNFQKHRHSF